MVYLDDGGSVTPFIQTVPVPDRLADLLEMVSVERTDARAARDRPRRIVADGAAHVIFHRYRNVSGELSVRCMAVGPRSTYADIGVAGRELTIALRLRPGALPALVGREASELLDRSMRLDGLLGRLHGSAESAPPQLLIEALLTALAAELRDRTPDRRVLGAAAALENGHPLDAVAAQCSLGCRSLRTLFHASIGIGPKRYARIARVQRALALKLAEPSHGWAAVAVMTGFSDQAHMTREFAALLGESPAQFVARAA